MRHIKPGESIVMQEFEKIAAEKGWMVKEAATDKETVKFLIGNLPNEQRYEMIPGFNWNQPLDKIVDEIVSNPELLKLYYKKFPITPSDTKPVRKGHPFNSLVQKVQNVLLEYFNDYMALGDYGADGRWGKKTAQAWNDWVQAVKYAPGLELHLVDPNGVNLPSNEELVYVAGKYGQSLRESRKFNPSSKEVKPTPQTERVTDLKNPWASLDMKNIKTADDLDKLLEKVPLEEEQKTRSSREALIQKAQHLLEMYGEDLGPKGADGKWGWFTSIAWNSYIKKVPTAGLPQTTPQRAPSDKDLIKMLGTNASQQLEPQYFAKEQQMTQPGLAPTASINIMNELIALANDLDEMGEIKVATAIDEQLSLYKTAVEKLYDITGETGEQLIGDAHPGGGPTMVPAKDEGGKVETIVEEQKKDMAVIDKQPTGKQAAFIAKQLVALANKLDAEGKVEAALLVDKTLAELREGSARPFVVKEALWGIVALIDALLKKIQDWSVQEPNYYSSVKSTLRLLKNYQDELYNAEKVNDKKKETQVLYSLNNDFPNIVHKLLDDAPPGTRIMIGQYIQGIQVNLLNKVEDFKSNENKLPVLQIGNTGKKNIPNTDNKTVDSGQEKENLKVYNNFLGTIDTLIKSLTNPSKQKEIQSLFGGEANLDKMLSGLEKLKQQVKKPTNAVERWRLQNRNIKMWNYYIKILKEHKLASIKFADDAPEGLVPIVTPNSAVTKTTKIVPKHRVRKEVRDDLKQLQGLMNQLQGMPPGRPGIADGKWGPKTREAWETMRSWTQNRAFSQSPPVNDPRGPLPSEVAKAIRVAEFIINRQQGTNTVPMGGVEVRIAALSNVDSFLKELARLGKIQKAETGSLNTTTNRRIAVQTLQSFVEITESDATLVAKFGKDGVNNLINRANALVSELERPIGIGDYSMPAGGQQYRQQGYQHGENIGEFGNLSGRQERGTPQQKQPQKNRPEPEMSLENEIRTLASENIPINDVQEALFWAHDFWKRHWQEMEDLGEGRKDYYVVARAVVKYLRQEISRLRGQLVRTPVRNKDDLDLELRRLSEDLSQMAQLLKR